MSPRGVVIAGGGTGGHIYPAIAVAQVIREKEQGMSIDFVGTTRGLETKIVPRENFPLHFVKVGALNGVGLKAKLLTLFSLPFAILQAMGILLRLKPRAVLGVGGYASGPVMAAAILLKPLLRFRLSVFESNAFPGLTNRWLSRFVDISFINFEDSKKYFKNPRVVGIPVRAGLLPRSSQPHPELRVLIFGGSQGAHGINMTVLDAVKKGGPWLEGVHIVHQIGSRDFKNVDAEYNALKPSRVQWFEFLYDMPQRYEWADLVICRAGASTLAELAACRKAAVLVPFPFAADNHQHENAQALANRGAAVVVTQKEFSAEKLMEIVNHFKNHRGELQSYESAVHDFFTDRSAEKIAEGLLTSESQRETSH